MAEVRTKYPNYNVLNAQDQWDDHTREIIFKRLGPFDEPKLLQTREVALLKAITARFTHDDRSEIIDYVIDHLDQRLSVNIGEGQREPNSPPLKDLIRLGLKALDKLAKKLQQKGFAELAVSEQKAMLASLSNDHPPALPDWQQVPPKAFFNKLMDLIISAYYSHPIVWSEIGYGGPAYPRGYYRIEYGLTDPWEAKRDEE